MCQKCLNRTSGDGTDLDSEGKGSQIGVNNKEWGPQASYSADVRWCRDAFEDTGEIQSENSEVSMAQTQQDSSKPRWGQEGLKGKRC